MTARFTTRWFALLAVAPLALPAPAAAQSCCTPIQTYRAAAPAPAYSAYRVASPVASGACCTEQASCCTEQRYRLQTSTTYEERQYTAYRCEREMVYEDVPVTVMKEEMVTEPRERRYKVARQVLETAAHDETYTVMRPVMVNEEREVAHTVMRPVYETAEREECVTVYKPVTTCRTEYVDQGGYVDQQVVTPGVTTSRLRWSGGNWVTDAGTGQTYYVPRWWRPTVVQTPPSYQTYRVYQPNVVQVQVPQTSMVPTTETRRVSVPTVRYEQVQEVRKVTCPVQRMVPTQQVRKVPATYKTVVEEQVEQYNVQVCRRVPVTETRRVARMVEKQVPVTYTYRVPHTTSAWVPVDACGNFIQTVVPSAAAAPAAGSDVMQSQHVGEPTEQPSLEVQRPVIKSEKVETQRPETPPAPPVKPLDKVPGQPTPAEPAEPKKTESGKPAGTKSTPRNENEDLLTVRPLLPVAPVSFPSRDVVARQE